MVYHAINDQNLTIYLHERQQLMSFSFRNPNSNVLYRVLVSSFFFPQSGIFKFDKYLQDGKYGNQKGTIETLNIVWHVHIHILIMFKVQCQKSSGLSLRGKYSKLKIIKMVIQIFTKAFDGRLLHKFNIRLRLH